MQLGRRVVHSLIEGTHFLDGFLVNRTTSRIAMHEMNRTQNAIRKKPACPARVVVGALVRIITPLSAKTLQMKITRGMV